MSASCCLSSRRAVEPGALLLASRTPWQGVAHGHPSCAHHHPPRPPATAAPPTLALPAPSHMRCGSGHETGCGSAINVYYGDHHTACPHTGTWPGCWFAGNRLVPKVMADLHCVVLGVSEADRRRFDLVVHWATPPEKALC